MTRKHSAAFKFEIVRQLQAGEKRLAQLCREHELDAPMVCEWRQRVEQRGAGAFPRSASGEEVLPSPATLASAQARIGELERLLGQVTLENDFLKKVSRHASSPAKKGSS